MLLVRARFSIQTANSSEIFILIAGISAWIFLKYRRKLIRSRIPAVRFSFGLLEFFMRAFFRYHYHRSCGVCYQSLCYTCCHICSLGNGVKYFQPRDFFHHAWCPGVLMTSYMTYQVSSRLCTSRL